MPFFPYKFNSTGIEQRCVLERYMRLDDVEKLTLDNIAYADKGATLDASGGHHKTSGVIKRLINKLIPEYAIEEKDSEYRKMMLVAIYWRYIKPFLSGDMRLARYERYRD